MTAQFRFVPPPLSLKLGASFDMEEDRLSPQTPDITREVVGTDLPADILALLRSFQKFYLDAEKQNAELPSTIHRADLPVISSRIKCLDEQIVQIARLHSNCDKLLSKRDEASLNLWLLTSILSPIRRVPIEVLCEIFMHCLPTAPFTAATNLLLPYNAPLILCQVCSHWRRTAIALPPLWKTLVLKMRCVFDDSSFSASVHPSIPPHFDTLVSRAGSWPLSLCLILHGNRITEGSDLSQKLEDVLSRLPNSRLQHLSLIVDWSRDAYFLSKISQEFTQLESIFLENRYGGISEPAPDCLFRSAPRLRSAELRNFVDLETFPKYWIPWSQLTHLRVEDELGDKMWYILLCHCTNLQHGIFSINGKDMGDHMIPTSDRSIVLSHLVDLTIHIGEYGGKPSFRRLVFPAIRKLQWLFDELFAPGYNQTVDDYLPVTGNDSLNTLVIIGDIKVGQPQLQSLVNSASITELHLSVATDYTDFFKNLTLSPYSQPLLPKLEALHCDIRDAEDYADAILESIASFVQSRCWDDMKSAINHSTARFRCLTVKFHGAVYEGAFMDQASQFLAPFMDQDPSLVLDTWEDSDLDLRGMMRFKPE